ncbi:FAD-dependent monooxygenase [Pleurocapsales cyanobacterium LEGE 06147]|nr:FAD-dependent monooxygenase [Pleurocapsales cyanobacterium LEGE 06147]
MENIIIVGAGLVGSLLSVYLARAGFKVSVYDRNSDPRQVNLQSGRSINITLSERGFRALDAVGAGDTVRELCIPVCGRIMHARDGELTYQPYGNNKEAIYSIGRDDLSKALVNFAQKHENIEFYFNQKCIDIDLPTARLKLQDLQTGEITQVQADRIFAADGAYSPVRYKMQRLKRFNYSQEYLDRGYKEIIIPAGNEGNWALEKNAIHIWPRDSFMLIGFPNLDKSFTLSLHLPYEEEISHNSTASPDALQNLFETYFPDIWPLVYPNLGDYAKKPVESMITIKCFPWSYQDKVLLIGDSCHAVVPSYGQGANAGFENCQLLTQCIEKHLGDWQTAFKEYETLRKPEMDVLAHLCLEHFTVLRKMVGDRKFIERAKIERKLQEMNSEYASLYYNISFTSMSYSEALRSERIHQEIISEFAEKNLKSEVSV